MRPINRAGIHRRLTWRLGAAALAVTTGLGVASAAPAAAHPDQPHVLVFSKTAGFRHDSIPEGIAAIQQLGQQNNFEVFTTEDAGAFTDANLSQYAAVVWLSTTGDVLNAEQQSAFERYVNGGGGYVGVHAASDTEYDWPWYGKLVGAYFKSHPHNQNATVKIEDTTHPSTAGLPASWQRFDEWYNYRTNPRKDVRVLATLDESTYSPGADAMGDHPIAWCHGQERGRSWYTGGGHTKESYGEENFRKHLLGGIQYAAGVKEADCSPSQAPVDADFDVITLAKGKEKTGEPMALSVLPDRRVVHTSRDGTVWLTTPDATTRQVGKIPVYNHDEDGLQGVAADPDFANNKWLYFFYAPPLNTPVDDPATPDVNEGNAPENGTPADFAPFNGYNQLSRFKLADDGTLDLASEQKILQIPAQRGLCCHVGGEIDFDAAGNLLMSTGDDTNPFASDGYTPIDERSTRNPGYDAQRTSANTNDLRGKLLRIKVNADGSYSIPEGNLFPQGTEKTRPEIYAMGFRNPFRFAVDKKTGWVYLGDYGPDAGSANPARGPGGTVEFNLIKGPGNYGWPYCVGDNQPFIDYNFETGQSGQPFDCAAPKNESPNNTGLVDLPPVQPAWIPYDGGSVPEFGTGGESPMGGPVYRYDANNPSPTKFPQYFDGKNFAYEWDRGWIKEITVGANGERGAIKPFMDSMTLVRPMNIEFGPDGSLYVLDYGTGYFGGSPESAIYRIDYTKGTRTPVVKLTADKTSGPGPLTVNFDPAGTTDPDGQPITYAWDFQNDGVVDSTSSSPVSHTYTTEGQFIAKLSVTDSTGLVGSANLIITVGNTAPTVTVQTPLNGGFFAFGDKVPFKAVITDPEDGTIDCSKVVVRYLLGHDNHAHELSQTAGCEGVIDTPAEGGHGDDSNIFGVINVEYTDKGKGSVPPLTGEGENIMQPKHKQAEFFSSMNGVQVVNQGEASGGKRVGYIDGGDWISFDPANLAGITGLGMRVSSGGTGGTIEVRSGAPDGQLLQTFQVGNTGGWDTYVDLPAKPVPDPGGTKPLYLVFQGTGSGGLFDVDVLRFEGPGVAQPPACQPTQPEAGYRSLYDGTAASLGNWKQAGPGRFAQQADCTILSEGGMGLLSFNEEFNAYSLKLDWKVAGDDNSGIFVGYPDPGNDPWAAVNQGYEIQIDATDAQDRTTGAIYSFQSADIAKRDAALKPPGEWNAYEIIVRGQTIQVWLNGVLINDFVSTDPNRDLTQGFIGLQNHGNGDDASFRNVRIKELETTPPVTVANFANPGGWHPGQVPVELAATDEGSGVARTEYKLDNGPWTTYSQPVVVTGDGQHTLLYRSVDKDGNVEPDKAATIQIDGSKPTLLVSGIADGRVYGDATDVVVKWHAEDATSGIASVTGSLDSTPIQSGQVTSLYQLPLGVHNLSVTALDKAGNRTEQKLTFATTTSLRDIDQLITRFRATNRLSLSASVTLSGQIAKARKAEAAGDDAKAVKQLRKFVELANDPVKVTDEDVRTTLVRDANAVIGSLEGGPALRRASSGS
ncbi:ThuA domain-containing protein [Kibdelosporangium persicum]|uniref:Soluble aldose sugar dehydrogenase YliI n=1 Tax=Kibdelosporangium persicum TaxID=2698649 RepID=A0ABX2EVH5_9PSEU|nr:Soluble aldose sugar dehydrogenase YliI [Kibdelosporangium persicum]